MKWRGIYFEVSKVEGRVSEAERCLFWSGGDFDTLRRVERRLFLGF